MLLALRSPERTSTSPPEPGTRGVLRPGARLDRYELLSLVAEGGMASVWVARLFGKHGFEKLVAIKTILPKFAEDPKFRRMFLDEAHIAAGIEHTNVARILDLGEEGGVLYLVMEWVDGDSLNKTQRLLAQKAVSSLPIGILLRLVADACAGLHSAHELRGRDGALLHVVHRDVSPQNILVSRDGAAKLIDFGIAKALDRTSDDTGSGTLKGKVQYMAPEQAMGNPVDRRADIWAVGAVLHNFFSGKALYEGDGQLAILHQLTSGKPPPALPATVPRPIAQVIDRALRLNPDERWPTAAEMQRQIEKAMTQSGCQTSTSDVAAFVAAHLPERSVNRRETIERSILATSEPVTIPPLASQSVVRTRTATTVVTPVGAVIAGIAGIAVIPEGAMRGPTESELPELPTTRPRLGLALGAVGALALGAAALIYALQPQRPPAPAAPTQATVEIRPFTIPRPPPAEPATTLPTLEPIPVEALPVAATAAARPPARPAFVPAPAAAGRDPAPAKKKVIDDGF
jgi:serine/threonine protein kinase